MPYFFIVGGDDAGLEAPRLDPAFKNIHGCIGCDTCIRKGEGCVFKDDMQELNPHLLDADAIVFVSPIYYYNINAQIKAVIDRFYANNNALQGDRKAMLIVTMADETMESADGPALFFRNMCAYMEWECKGTLAAAGCWRREDMEKSGYPQKAYEWGKKI